MFSKVPVVRRALVEMFTNALNQPGDPAVLYAHNRDDGDYFVSVGTADGFQSERTIKRMPHDTGASVDEDFTFDVGLWNLLPGRNDGEANQESAEAAFAVMERLDFALRSDYQLGGLVTWAHFGSFTSKDYALTEGRATDIVTTVTVKSARQ